MLATLRNSVRTSRTSFCRSFSCGHSFESLLERNDNWSKTSIKENPEYFERTAKAQAPPFLYLGCSDSRVNPSQMFKETNPSNDFFVHRNIGNVFSVEDASASAVLDYSIGVLKVGHIICCGHTECGAVYQAMAKPKEGGLGPLERWINPIREVAEQHWDELKDLDPAEQHKKLVELHVKANCLKVKRAAPVQAREAAGEKISVTGIVYDVADGSVTKVMGDDEVEDAVQGLKEIYSVYN
eukprot:augustus_masked-scaffold_5-processed-gene-3.37-mRNA-1 protein AED:0.10 eAED:0.12 QI:0/-1/0/1/-1/1/1/0/239